MIENKIKEVKEIFLKKFLYEPNVDNWKIYSTKFIPDFYEIDAKSKTCTMIKGHIDGISFNKKNKVFVMPNGNIIEEEAFYATLIPIVASPIHSIGAASFDKYEVLPIRINHYKDGCLYIDVETSKLINNKYIGYCYGDNNYVNIIICWIYNERK